MHSLQCRYLKELKKVLESLVKQLQQILILYLFYYSHNASKKTSAFLFKLSAFEISSVRLYSSICSYSLLIEVIEKITTIESKIINGSAIAASVHAYPFLLVDNEAFMSQ